jgi:hypothetical protein
MARYRDFFGLCEGFTGYADFFLLQGLAANDCSLVTVFPPFDDFKTPAVANDVNLPQPPAPLVPTRESLAHQLRLSNHKRRRP